MQKIQNMVTAVYQQCLILEVDEMYGRYITKNLHSLVYELGVYLTYSKTNCNQQQ